MSDDFLDFFAGHEGEPAHLFFVDGCLRVRCWEGHISALLDSVSQEQGRWNGLAEAHHLDWWRDYTWRVMNSTACLTQLKQAQMRDGLKACEAEQVRKVRLALLELFQDADRTGGEVIVRRD